MHPIGTFASLASDGLQEISAHLPWGWFILLALIDVGLVAVVLHRHNPTRLAFAARRWAHRVQPEAMIVRSGWLVPRSRTLALPPHTAAYAWPLHSEYPVTRIP